MKIKVDFVTNSSSSSFIVAFPYKIESEEQLYEFIEQWKCSYVFKQCQHQKPIRIAPEKYEKLIKEMGKRIRGSYIEYNGDHAPDYYETQEKICEMFGIDQRDFYNDRVWNQIFWDFERKIEADFAAKVSEHFLKNASGYMYFFRFSDEGGELESDLEHGSTFRKLHHIHCNNH